MFIEHIWWLADSVTRSHSQKNVKGVSVSYDIDGKTQRTTPTLFRKFILLILV